MGWSVEVERLQCYDVLAIALVVFSLELVMRLWGRRGEQLTPEEQALMGEYNEQVRLVNRLNSVDTFVEQSKATRKMNSLKKQMQELAGGLTLPRIWRVGVPKLTGEALTLVLCVVGCCSRSHCRECPDRATEAD